MGKSTGKTIGATLAILGLMAGGYFVVRLLSEDRRPAVVLKTDRGPAAVSPTAPARRPKAAEQVPLATLGLEPNVKTLRASVPAPAGSESLRVALSLPSQVASSKPNIDPMLVRWLEVWERPRLRGEGESVSADEVELERLLAKTKLRAAELYEIGQIVGSMAMDPLEVKPLSQARAAHPWYRRAAERAVDESHELQAGSAAALRLVELLQKMEGTFSLLYDGAALEKSMAAKVRLLPEGDPRLVTARTDHAGALWMQGRNDQAMQEIIALAENPMVQLSPAQLTEARWVHALTLHAAAQYARAVPLLEVTAQTKGYRHAIDAHVLLCTAYAHLGDRRAAIEAIRRARQQFGMTRQQVLPIAEEVQRILVAKTRDPVADSVVPAFLH